MATSRENNAFTPTVVFGADESVMESGVDWLSLTCTDAANLWRFRDMGVALVEKEAGLGEKAQPLTFMGMQGLKAGGCGYVESDEMAMMRLSGPTAWAHWRRAYGLATNCSRIDLQVTVSGVVSPNARIVDHHADALARIAGWLRPPTVDIRMSNRTGHTLYLNQRTSTRFGRVYNKGIESKLAHYKNCVRYELQCNGKYALRQASSLASLPSYHTAIAGRVHVFFSEHLGPLPWHLEEGFLLGSPRKRTTNARRLSWLSSQVRGCVRELLEAGLYDEVVDALCLRDYDVDQLVQSMKRGNE